MKKGAWIWLAAAVLADMAARRAASSAMRAAFWAASSDLVADLDLEADLDVESAGFLPALE